MIQFRTVKTLKLGGAIGARLLGSAVMSTAMTLLSLMYVKINISRTVSLTGVI